MSQFRQNPITKNWVLISTHRAKRPEDYKTYSVTQGLGERDENCVFCPGNEQLNPQIDRRPNNDDWQIRVIPNKYNALEHGHVYRRKEFYVSRSGNGDHEVIITRKHNEPVALQSIALVENTLGLFVERLNFLGEDEKNAYTQIFHNHGREAGASVIHPHYQILTTPFITPHIHSEIMGCYHHYQTFSACIYCEIIKEELALGLRVVYESDHFVVISAYASRSPFETWILPKKHGAKFEEITKEQVKHLSFVLKVTLGQLYTKLNDPPLNFYIHTMPYVRDKHTINEEASFHWHLTIFPRLTIWAGFEFATGIPINPVPPEMSAEFLRSHLI